jgi:hypothetical protein
MDWRGVASASQFGKREPLASAAWIRLRRATVLHLVRTSTGYTSLMAWMDSADLIMRTAVPKATDMDLAESYDERSYAQHAGMQGPQGECSEIDLVLAINRCPLPGCCRPRRVGNQDRLGANR